MQKFPQKRVDAYDSTKANGKPAAGQQNNSPQQQQQYSAVQMAPTNEQTGANQDKQQLVPNGNLPAINSFQLQSGKSKQCEIHHNVLHPNSRQQQAAVAAAGGAKKAKQVNFCRAWLNKFPSRSKRIDVISRIFFPKMFALFNLVYWTTYLFREDDTVRS